MDPPFSTRTVRAVVDTSEERRHASSRATEIILRIAAIEAPEIYEMSDEDELVDRNLRFGEGSEPLI